MTQAKSLQQQRLDGTLPHKLRPTVLGDGQPQRPTGLSKEGELFWSQSIEPLIEQGVVKQEDQPALEALLYWWCVFRSSQRAVLNISEYDWGSTETQRTINANSRAYDNWRRLAQQFGLTAQARNSVSPGEVDDDLAEFMAGE